jgi:ABC-type nitrate/sulfonate/bicarbonate transport system substrate-binding protein
MRILDIVRPAIAGVIVGILLTGVAGAAETTLKFAFNKSIDQLPIFVADKKGYLAAEGLKIDYLAFNNGPAAASAVAGGSADIGYAATMPVIVARSEGQPFKLFAALDFETAPTDYSVVLVASGRSGVQTLGELKSKTLALNTVGGQCELLARVQLKKSGVEYDAVKVVSVPFPQMQQTLQLGTVDAVCAFDPFRTSILQAPLNAKVLAAGMIGAPDFKGRYLNTGLYARADWIEAHPAEIKALVSALSKAVDTINSNDAEARQILGDEMKFPEAVLKGVRINFKNGIEVRASDLQPVIDSAFSVGMLKTKLDASDVVISISPK